MRWLECTLGVTEREGVAYVGVGAPGQASWIIRQPPPLNPQPTREAVRLRNTADVFPYGTCTSATMDLDHTLAYIPPDPTPPDPATSQRGGGPPDQTSVTNHGTLALGRTPYARATWHAAAPTAAALVEDKPNDLQLTTA